jgi:DNA (cytosine-5)-methyltransferase 1
MLKIKNTLSLFNGMSCLKMANDIVGIGGNYYYSEVDKWANKLTQELYPDAIPLGDVRNVDCSKLPKIDFLAGGSPCQSFSFAGKRKGMTTKCEIEITTLEQYLELKENNFEFEGQSYLFWEYVRILIETKPKYFLLENVIMVEKWRTIISQTLGIAPIRINSALLSAQNRDRYYWTNIYTESQGLFGFDKCMIPQPKDKGILLRDILEDEVDEKYFLSEKMVSGLLQWEKRNKENGNGFSVQLKKENEKSSILTTGSQKNNSTYVLAQRQVNQINPSVESGGKQPYQQNRVYDTNGISPGLCANKSDLLILGADYRKDEGLRIRENGKSGTLAARARNDESCGQLAVSNKSIRRLTPREVLRLQTVPGHLIDKILSLGISDTQIYKMAGNGWTIEVIAHILKHIQQCLK